MCGSRVVLSRRVGLNPRGLRFDKPVMERYATPPLSLRRLLARTALLAGIIAVIYLPAAHGPMVFDDLPGVITNLNVQQVWPLHVAADAPPNTPFAARPIAAFSMAVNYAVHGFDPAGYRWTNAALHLLAGVLVMLLMDRLLRRTRLHRSASSLAFIIALLWVAHPLQTDSVAYIVNRSKGLETLFALLAVYLFLRADAAVRSMKAVQCNTQDGDLKQVSAHASAVRPWLAGSVLAALAAMLSKESAAAIPLLVLLVDRQWVAGSFRLAWRRRRGYYLALFACWLPLAGLMLQGGRAASVGFDHGISAWHYLLTQAQIVTWYLQSVVWPRHLAIHHEWPVVTELGPALLPGSFLIALLAWTTYALIRRRPEGVAGAVFFLMLGPTSSFIPMSTELVAERRMQLPLLAVIVVLVMVLTQLARRVRRAQPHLPRLPQVPVLWRVVLVVVLMALTARAASRAWEFRSAEAHWQGVLAMYPDSPVGLNNLAVLRAMQGETDEATALYRRAAAHSTGHFILPHLNLARQLRRQGRADEAMTVLKLPLRKIPTTCICC